MIGSTTKWQRRRQASGNWREHSKSSSARAALRNISSNPPTWWILPAPGFGFRLRMYLSHRKVLMPALRSSLNAISDVSPAPLARRLSEHRPVWRADSGCFVDEESGCHLGFDHQTIKMPNFLFTSRQEERRPPSISSAGSRFSLISLTTLSAVLYHLADPTMRFIFGIQTMGPTFGRFLVI